MSLRKYISREVITASSNASIQEVAQLMQKHNVGSVIIVNDTNQDSSLVGIVTDRGILLKILAHDVDLSKTTIKELIHQDILALKETEGFKETVSKMAEKGIRRAPVVDEQNRVIGIITLDDLLSSLIDKLVDIKTILGKQGRKTDHK